MSGPGFLDRVLLQIAPERALSRARAQRAARAVMGYDAGGMGRRAASLRGRAGDADAAILTDGARLRQRVREMIRNNGLANRAQSVIAGHTVGAGIVPSFPTECITPDVAARVQRAYRRHLNTARLDARGELKLAGMQRQIIRSVVADGEVLVRRRMRRGVFAAGLDLPFQLEVIEADQLDLTLTAHKGNEVLHGVEIGPTGAVVAYHILRHHPGSISRKANMRDTERVPANDIAHIRRLDRPGQVRGVSWFAPVLLRLSELTEFQEGELLKQRLAALMAGVIERDPDETGAGSDPMQIEELAPGAIVELPPGAKINWTTPPTVNSLDSYMIGHLREIAVGLGITYEELTGDLSKVNFSSGRMGWLAMWRNVETWQSDIMIDQFCRRVEQWTTESLRLAGVDVPLDYEWPWTAPRRPLIDPTREVAASLSQIDGGLTSRQRVIREMGRDPAEIAAERAEDAAQDQQQITGPAGEEE